MMFRKNCPKCGRKALVLLNCDECRLVACRKCTAWTDKTVQRTPAIKGGIDGPSGAAFTNWDFTFCSAECWQRFRKRHMLDDKKLRREMVGDYAKVAEYYGRGPKNK